MGFCFGDQVLFHSSPRAHKGILHDRVSEYGIQHHSGDREEGDTGVEGVAEGVEEKQPLGRKSEEASIFLVAERIVHDQGAECVGEDEKGLEHKRGRGLPRLGHFFEGEQLEEELHHLGGEYDPVKPHGVNAYVVHDLFVQGGGRGDGEGGEGGEFEECEECEEYSGVCVCEDAGR